MKIRAGRGGASRGWLCELVVGALHSWRKQARGRFSGEQTVARERPPRCLMAWLRPTEDEGSRKVLEEGAGLADCRFVQQTFQR